MKVEYVDSMGDDMAVARAAWVSTNRTGSAEDVRRLIGYLARNNHWTPFAQVQIKLLFEIPIFVARQLMRSNVGIVWNEESRRYVDHAPKFWEPEFRKRGKSIKQGSLDEPVDGHMQAMSEYQHAVGVALTAYERLLGMGVAPEVARTVLPVAAYTRIMATGSLAAWARVYNLRKDAHAQKEIRQLAEQMDAACRHVAPISWKALTEGRNDSER